MSSSSSRRILVTPSLNAKKHYLYVQEVGTLKCIEPHISSRKSLNSFLFFVVVTGSGTVTINKKEYPLKSGDCVWLDCRNTYSHESSTTDPWSLTWVHFYGEEAGYYFENYIEQENPGVFHPSNSFPFIDKISSLYECCQASSFISELKAHRLLTDLITMIFTAQAVTEDSISGKLTQIKSYIEEHYNEKITLDELSELFFVSKFHLSREYHRAYGNTIVDDITTKRISKAKEQLRFTDEPVETVAENCGYQDNAYFTNVFKKLEGATPMQYRKRWRS